MPLSSENVRQQGLMRKVIGIVQEKIRMLQAIETVYKNYRFRSRLEARWAVFMDTLGVKYEYEKEGYNLDGLYYLPDFWLPEQQCWMEIKGQELTAEAFTKAIRLAHHSGKPVFLFKGEITVPLHAVAPFASGFAPQPEMDGDDCSWCECPYCRAVGITRHGDGRLLPCGCLQTRFPSFPELDDKDMESMGRKEEDWPHLDWWYYRFVRFFETDDSPRLIAAYTAARQARFEHAGRGGRR